MTRANLIATLAVLAIVVGAGRGAWSQETLKVAIPQRGAWDAGVAELGQRGGIFKKHGLDLEILYVQAGPESIQAVIGGSMDGNRSRRRHRPDHGRRRGRKIHSCAVDGRAGQGAGADSEGSERDA